MIKAVLDSNVLISAAFWNGPPRRIVRKGVDRDFQIIISEPLAEEVLDKLLGKFRASADEVKNFLGPILAHAELVISSTHLRVVKTDPDDDKIIECALAGNADYIVTGDRDLLDMKQYQSITIITPAQFIKML